MFVVTDEGSARRARVTLFLHVVYFAELRKPKKCE